MRKLPSFTSHAVILALVIVPAAPRLLAPRPALDAPASHNVPRRSERAEVLVRESEDGKLRGELEKQQEEDESRFIELDQAAFDLDHLPFETDLAAGFYNLAARAAAEPLVDGKQVKEPEEMEPKGFTGFMRGPLDTIRRWRPFGRGKTQKYKIEKPLANITRTKPFLWVHIHKAGGTFMCALAKLAGETVVEPADGACNWREHDQYKNSGKHSRISCEARQEYFLNPKRNYTWGQIEREFVKEDRCWDQFDYGVTLRDPIELLQSEINYHPGCWLFGGPCGGGPEDPEKFLKHLKDTLESPPPAGGADQYPLWKFFDNIQTRLLAPALEVAPGGINASHVRAAKRTLGKMKAVIRLEDMPTEGHKLFKTLGWPRQMTKHVGQRVNPSEHDFQFSRKQKKWLEEVNKHDRILYELYGS